MILDPHWAQSLLKRKKKKQNTTGKDQKVEMMNMIAKMKNSIEELDDKVQEI